MSSENTIDATFTRETTNKNIKSEPNFTMMSATGKKLAAKTAPASAYVTNVAQSAVDSKMRRKS